MTSRNFGQFSARRLMGNAISDNLADLRDDVQSLRVRRRFDETADNLPDLIGKRIISPADENYTEPTDENFEGWVMSAASQALADGNFTLAYVLAGTLVRYGIGDAGEFIRGVDFLSSHIATVGAYTRRARRGFQEVDSKPAYRLEYFDTASGTNLVTTNPGFEAGNVTSGWTATAGAYGAWSAGVEADGWTPYEGTYYARYAYSGAVQSLAPYLVSAKYASTAGVLHSFAVPVRLYGGYTCSIMVKWYNATPTLVQTDVIYSGGNPGSADWSLRLANFVAPAGSTQFEIRVEFLGTSANMEALVDKVIVFSLSEYEAVQLSDDGVDLIEGATYARYADGKISLPQSTLSDPNSVSRINFGVSPVGYPAQIPAYFFNNGREMPLVGPTRFRADIFSEFMNIGSGLSPFTSSIIGAFGTLANLAAEADHPGIIRIGTNGAFANYGYAIGLESVKNLLLGPGDIFECVFRLPTTANVMARLGFQDSLGTAAPTDGAFININGTTLDGRNYNGGATSTTSTSYTITANTWYSIKIWYEYYIGPGVRVSYALYSAAGALLWSSTLATNMPAGATSVAMLAYKTNTGAADLLDLDWAAYHNYSLTR